MSVGGAGMGGPGSGARTQLVRYLDTGKEDSSSHLDWFFPILLPLLAARLSSPKLSTLPFSHGVVEFRPTSRMFSKRITATALHSVVQLCTNVTLYKLPTPLALAMAAVGLIN
eukprot:849061-Ditylum_brightwellii.AAC.1